MQNVLDVPDDAGVDLRQMHLSFHWKHLNKSTGNKRECRIDTQIAYSLH